MVKPPSSMRPEAVDLSKAGRVHTRSFQESSFHNYMARKIHLQRRQFGVVEPPPAPPSPPTAVRAGSRDSESIVKSPTTIQSKHPPLQLQLTPSRGTSKPPAHQLSSKKSPPAREGSSSSTGTSVRSSTKKSSSSRKKRDAVPTADLGGLLKRLKRRHGDVPPAAAAAQQSTPSTGTTADAPSNSRQSVHGTRTEPIQLFQENVQNSNAAATALGESASPDLPTRDSTCHLASCDEPGCSSVAAIDATPSRQRLDLPCRQESSEVGTVSGGGASGSTTRRRSNDRPDLFFRGVVVLINGYTEPDAGTLQRMLHRHGGDVEKYETNHVTAIIASELSHAKAEVYRNLTRKPLPVIRPEWIVDCVRAQSLLPYQTYILGRLRTNKYGGQVQSINRFFPTSKASLPPTTASDAAVASDLEATTTSGHSFGSKSELPRRFPPLAASAFKKDEGRRTGDIEVQSSDQKMVGSADGDLTLLDLALEGTGNVKRDLITVPNGSPANNECTEWGATGASTIVKRPSTDQDGTPPLDQRWSRERQKPSLRKRTMETAPDSSLLLHETPMMTKSAERDGENGLLESPCRLQLAQTQESAREEEEDDDDDDENLGGGTGDDPCPQRATTPAVTEVTSASPAAKVGWREQDGHPSSRTDERHINGRIRTVGTDPHFLENFFSKSRLSFIGSFKQRARSSPEKLANKSKHQSSDTRRWVLHVDIDSFFASVVLRDFPQYRDKPVVISHQGNGNQLKSNYSSTSTSECATCNYKARELGIKKGMFLGRAHELCKSAGFQLIVLPYDFDGYEEVKEKVAEILFRYASDFDGTVNQVSCDESYMEIFLPARSQDTAAILMEAEQFAQSIRREIFETTECTASIGVAKNMFLAKLATDSVKPDGCCAVQDYRKLLSPLSLRQLPGIGYHLEEKLTDSGLSTVQQVWDLGDKAHRVLEGILGEATGKKIHNFCLGKDERPVVATERKSIGAECSYGVRFDGEYGPDYMISCLATEVVKRMNAVGVRGGSKVTLKIKKRKPNAKVPMKFLGHGSCDNFSRSCDVPAGATTLEAELLTNLCLTLYRQLDVSKEDVRGMGIVVSKLTLIDTAGPVASDVSSKQPSLRSWLSSRAEPVKPSAASSLPVASTSNGVRTRASGIEPSSMDNENDVESDCIEVDPGFELPSLSQVRMSQVECLPSPMKRYALSRIKASRVKERTTTTSAVEPRKRKMQQPKLAPLAVKARSIGSTNRKVLKIRKSATARRASSRSTMRQKRLSGADPQALFVDDVYPLSLFMDENPSADAGAQNHVTEFLLICVAEKRLGDVVVLLRSIRNRKDRWGEQQVIRPMFDQVNDAVEASEGSRLDMNWI